MKIKKRCKMNEALENISEIDGVYGQVDLTTAQAKKDSERIKSHYKKIKDSREKEMKEFQAMNDRREIPNIKRTNKFELDESLFEDCGRQKKSNKKVTESVSDVFNHEYYDLVEKELDHTNDLDMIELVLNTLDGIDDYSSEDEQLDAVDNALIYDEDIWTIMQYFFASDPKHVNYNKSIDYFTEVIMSICNQIANKLPKDESISLTESSRDEDFEDYDMFTFIMNLFTRDLKDHQRPLNPLGRKYKHFEYLSQEEDPEKANPQVSTDMNDNIVLYSNNAKDFDDVIEICNKYKFENSGVRAAKSTASKYSYSLTIVVPKYKNGYPMDIAEYFEGIGMTIEDVMPKWYLNLYYRNMKNNKKAFESIEAEDNSEDLTDEELNEILDFNIGDGTQNNSSDIKLDIPFIPGV